MCVKICSRIGNIVFWSPFPFWQEVSSFFQKENKNHFIYSSQCLLLCNSKISFKSKITQSANGPTITRWLRLNNSLFFMRNVQRNLEFCIEALHFVIVQFNIILTYLMYVHAYMNQWIYEVQEPNILLLQKNYPYMNQTFKWLKKYPNWFRQKCRFFYRTEADSWFC